MSGALGSLPREWAHLYPFAPRVKALSCGQAMSYLDEGEGFPVVMVHGNPTWSFYYRNPVLALRGQFRCIAPDHIGCGLSDKPRREDYPFTLEQRIKDLGELIDHLGLDRFDLVVHDWGGAIGLGAALQRLDRLRRVMILNTAAFTDERMPQRIAVCRIPVIGKLIVQGCNGFARPALKMAVSKRPLDAAVKQGLLYPYRSWASRLAVYEFVKDIPMSKRDRSWGTLKRVEAELPRLKERDVHIAWGGRDFCFDDHFLERWKRILPQATVMRFPEAGHYVLEDEREKVVAALEQMVAYD